ncbi:MAG: hypothetical protein ACKOCE_06895 [Acidimicrobiia bacterium]
MARSLRDENPEILEREHSLPPTAGRDCELTQLSVLTLLNGLIVSRDSIIRIVMAINKVGGQVSYSISCGRLGSKQLGKARFNGRDTIRLRVPWVLIGVGIGKLRLNELTSFSFLPVDTFLGGATGTWAVYIKGTKRGKSVVWKFPFFKTRTSRTLEKRKTLASEFVHTVGRAAGLSAQIDGKAIIYDRSGRVSDLPSFTKQLDDSSSIETADEVFLDDEDDDFDVADE